MINSLCLKNVRVFEEPGGIFRLPPLCVFCGANSAGKSTLLKTILLMRQSQGQGTNSANQPGYLRFVGPQVDLGDYTAFVSHNDISRSIVLGFSAPAHLSPNTEKTLSDIGKTGSRHHVTHPQPKEDNSESNIQCNLIFESTLANQAPNTGSGGERIYEWEANKGAMVAAEYILVKHGKKLLEWRVRRSTTECEEHGDYETKFVVDIPTDYFRRVGGYTFFDVQHPDDKPFLTVPVLLDGLFPGAMIVKGRRRSKKQERPNTEEERWSSWILPPAIRMATKDLQDALESIHYLGPLRAPAKRYYLLSPDRTVDLDEAGEFLPFALIDNAKRYIYHLPPKERNKVIRQPFSEALETWVHYIRTGSNNEIGRSNREIAHGITGNVLLEFKIRTTIKDELHALADSGFGYSQVLPILARGLLAGSENTLMIEQPELHLNPAVQVRLAEFFVSLILTGKQVLIETHSEHLVNAIRVLCAEDRSGQIAANTCIHFADLTPSGVNMQELSIQADGTVPEWPISFFGEALQLSGRLLRAQQRFRS